MATTETPHFPPGDLHRDGSFKSSRNEARGSLGSIEAKGDAIDEKRLMRRIDFFVIPWLSFLYLLCFLDRVGIGNARVRVLAIGLLR